MGNPSLRLSEVPCILPILNQVIIYLLDHVTIYLLNHVINLLNHVIYLLNHVIYLLNYVFYLFIHELQVNHELHYLLKLCITLPINPLLHNNAFGAFEISCIWK